jgi:hypothetical protein
MLPELLNVASYPGMKEFLLNAVAAMKPQFRIGSSSETKQPH